MTDGRVGEIQLGVGVVDGRKMVDVYERRRVAGGGESSLEGGKAANLLRLQPPDGRELWLCGGSGRLASWQWLGRKHADPLYG